MCIFRLGVSMQKFSKRVKGKLSFYVVVLALLLSCAPITVIPTPTEPPGPPDGKPCTDKDSEDPNIYQAIEIESLANIYQNALLDGSSPLMFDQNKLSGAKTDAYRRLATSVRNWTTAADIPVKVGGTNSYFIRVTLTFISPELIELVLLNQTLGETPPISRETFVERVNAKIAQFGDRQEITFLLTFTSTYRNSYLADPNVLRINANVGEIMLLDADSKEISKKHSEPALGQDGYLSRESLSGYIGYPMFAYRNKKCIETLDSEYTASITVKIGKLSINGSEIEPIILSIRHRPLLDLENTRLPEPIPIPNNNLRRELTIKDAPPDPVGLAKNEDALYWQDMASYIWWYLASP